MEIIIEYFVSAVKAILGLFNVALDEEFEDNIRSMIGGLVGFEPETEAGAIDM